MDDKIDVILSRQSVFLVMHYSAASVLERASSRLYVPFWVVCVGDTVEVAHARKYVV